MAVYDFMWQGFSIIWSMAMYDVGDEDICLFDPRIRESSV